MPPPLTVLLVTMNRRELLEIGLWYLYETSTDEERDLWIWDNASSDDTPDFLGTMVGWPGVRVFQSRVNVGLAGARRRMITHVRTPYVFTLDDDVWLLTRGWAAAAAKVFAADPSIGQLMVPQGHVDPSSGFGVVHEKLDRPFFRVPPVLPRDRDAVTGDLSHDLRHHVDLRGAPPPFEGVRVEDVAGERLAVPLSGTQLPLAVSGSCSSWRTEDVLPLARREDRHPVVDLREAWSFPIQAARRAREALLLGHGMMHPCPGPLWHLGRGELHWETRCRMAPAIYGRTGEEQRRWLEVARAASGWGRPLEDPDVLA